MGPDIENSGSSPAKSARAVLARYRLPLLVASLFLLTGTVLIQVLPFAHMAWDAVRGAPDLE